MNRKALGKQFLEKMGLIFKKISTPIIKIIYQLIFISWIIVTSVPTIMVVVFGFKGKVIFLFYLSALILTVIWLVLDKLQKKEIEKKDYIACIIIFSICIIIHFIIWRC